MPGEDPKPFRLYFRGAHHESRVPVGAGPCSRIRLHAPHFVGVGPDEKPRERLAVRILDALAENLIREAWDWWDRFFKQHRLVSARAVHSIYRHT